MLTEQVRELPQLERRLLTGVYAIRNVVNGKMYIGSAACRISGRWGKHRMELRRGCHGNCHLQNAWNKYGESSFEFLVLLRCPPESCVAEEQRLMDEYRTADRNFGYNLYPNARSPLGVIRPPSVGRAVAEANRRRVYTPAMREARSVSRRGKKVLEDSRGEKNGNAKMTEQRVRAMRGLWATGRYTIHRLSELFKIGYTATSDIVARRRWKHVN